MEPQSAHEFALWKDRLYQRARHLIAVDPKSFTLAGDDLAQTFSCDFIHEQDADTPESPRLGWAPERLLITRICYARSAAIGHDAPHLVSRLDFRFVGKITERLHAARQVILAILLAGDPDANEYISPEMCELASLQYETTDGQVLGRGFVPWYWEQRDLYLCTDSGQHCCPPPAALKTLEAACILIESRAEKPRHKHALETAETEPVPELIQLEKKEIGVLKWLAHPSRRHRAWHRSEVLPVDTHTPTDPRYLRAIINRLHALGLIDSPPRQMVRIKPAGLVWLEKQPERE